MDETNPRLRWRRNTPVRWRAEEALERAGDEVRTALPALIAALSDPDWRVRCGAAEALGVIDVPAEGVVPALTAAIRDPNSTVRWTAIDALGMIGESAATAVPQLLALVRPEDWKIRAKVAQTLGLIKNPADLVTPTLIALLKDPYEFVRGVARDSLVRLGHLAIPGLNSALNSSDRQIGSSVTAVLAQIDPGRLLPPSLTLLPQVHELRVELRHFYLIGQTCLNGVDGAFSIRSTAVQLDISPPTLQGQIQRLTSFFRDYFEQHGHPPVRGPFVAAEDDDPLAAEEDKIVERSERRRYRICEPVGRWAWELTRDYLAWARVIPADQQK